MLLNPQETCKRIQLKENNTQNVFAALPTNRENTNKKDSS